MMFFPPIHPKIAMGALVKSGAPRWEVGAVALARIVGFSLGPVSLRWSEAAVRLPVAAFVEVLEWIDP